jgi:hypothetical protein
MSPGVELSKSGRHNSGALLPIGGASARVWDNFLVNGVLPLIQRVSATLLPTNRQKGCG